MGFSTFSQYVAVFLLSLVPLIKVVRFILSFRGNYYTSSGRLIDVHEEKESRLEEKIKKEGIFLGKNRKINNVKVIELPNIKVVNVIGFYQFIKPAVIVISPGLDLLSESLFQWIYKRQGYCLVKRTSLVTEIIKILAIIIAVIVFGKLCLYSLVIPFFLLILTCKILDGICEYIVEIRADDYVMNESSLKELQEALSFLKAQINRLDQNEYFFNFSGYFFKKTSLFRIKKLESAIGKENLKEDIQRIKEMESFLEKNFLEEQKFIEDKKMRVLRWIDADED